MDEDQRRAKRLFSEMLNGGKQYTGPDLFSSPGCIQGLFWPAVSLFQSDSSK